MTALRNELLTEGIMVAAAESAASDFRELQGS
jgi:hypothetical protein